MTDGRGLRFEVVIPTRNRPEKLRRCLVALGASQGDRLPVLVCDSSDDERHDAVRSVCSDFPSARLVRHSGQNVAAARNACARHAHGDVLINVDDDICVDSDAVTRLIDCYAKTARLCVMAGAVSWGGHYSRPIVMRHIGYGRSARGTSASARLTIASWGHCGGGTVWRSNIVRMRGRHMMSRRSHMTLTSRLRISTPTYLMPSSPIPARRGPCRTRSSAFSPAPACIVGLFRARVAFALRG